MILHHLEAYRIQELRKASLWHWLALVSCLVAEGENFVAQDASLVVSVLPIVVREGLNWATEVHSSLDETNLMYENCG